MADQAGFSELVLYEGFVTFKSAVTDHERDARLLLDSLLGIHKCDVISLNTGGGQAVVTVVDVIRDSISSSVPPAIIIPKKENE